MELQWELSAQYVAEIRGQVLQVSSDSESLKSTIYHLGPSRMQMQLRQGVQNKNE